VANNDTHQYVVNFLFTQRGEFTHWIEQMLLAGLREGETLQCLTITELKPSNEVLQWSFNDNQEENEK
jgi:hypothetical protein